MNRGNNMSKPVNTITPDVLVAVVDFGCSILKELGQPRLAEVLRLEARREIESASEMTRAPADVRNAILDAHKLLMERVNPSDN